MPRTDHETTPDTWQLLARDAVATADESSSLPSAGNVDGTLVHTPLADEGEVRGCLQVIGYLVVVHAWTALHATLGFGGLTGFVYAVFPPVVVWLLGSVIVEFPTFTSYVMAVFVALVATILLLWRRRFSRFRPDWSVIGWGLPVVAIWLPVAAASLASHAVIGHAIHAAQPECHETRGFIASLHDKADTHEHAQAHAWMIVHGRRFIWSYSEMEFVVDSRPLRYGGTCR